MDLYDKALVTVLAVSALLIVLAVPLLLRRVPRNGLYGYRARATLSSDELWYAANVHFARGLVLAGMAGALLMILVHQLRPSPAEDFLTLSVLILTAPTLIAALATHRHVRRLQRSPGMWGMR